jgi:hypothetical protein
MHPAVEQGQQQLQLCRGKMQLTRRSVMLLEHVKQKMILSSSICSTSSAVASWGFTVQAPPWCIGQQ